MTVRFPAAAGAASVPGHDEDPPPPAPPRSPLRPAPAAPRARRRPR